MYEILFAKIIAIDKQKRELTLTTSLKAVWESVLNYNLKIMMGMDLLTLYLAKIAELERFYRYKPISSLTLGQKVNATVENITESGTLTLRLNDHDLKGVVQPEHYLDVPKEGDTVFGIIMWKNYIDNVVEMSLLPRVINSIARQDLLPALPTASLKRAEILLVTKWFLLMVVKHEGKGYLAAMPVRRHKNDTDPDTTPYKIHAKTRVYTVLAKSECDILPTCMLKSIFKSHLKSIAYLESESTIPPNNKQELKRKRVSESNDVDLANPPKKASKEVPKKALEKENEKKSEVEDNESRIKDIYEHSESEEETEEEQSVEKLCIPERGFLWDDKAKMSASSDTEMSSSDDEKEPEEELEQKKKKLNATERREQKRQEEREIRQQEEVLASNQGVSIVDDFEKLVLASPNNALVWCRYMAHHIQDADIDKARAVARRALKTINIREEIELLSLWKSWLNMESKFGTVEYLNHVFQEALKANDEYKMYAHVLNIHAETGRKNEFEKVMDKMIRKFKKDPQTWIDCGAASLKIGMKEKSRQIMQRALQSLPESERKYSHKHTLF